MSWNGFKKGVSRVGISVRQMTGSVEKTIDKNFEEEERKYKTLELKMEKLYKDSKAYLDAVRAISTAQKAISDDWVQFMEGDSDMSRLAKEYQKHFIELEDVRSEYDHTYQEAVLDPIAKYVLCFESINAALKKRAHKLLDYDAARSKVKRLVQNPSKDSSKLGRNEEKAEFAREIFDSVHGPLIEEIPRFIALREPYLLPVAEIHFKAQKVWLHEVKSHFAKFTATLASSDASTGSATKKTVPSPPPPYSSNVSSSTAKWDDQIQDALNRVKGLNIATPIK